MNKIISILGFIFMEITKFVGVMVVVMFITVVCDEFEEEK